MRWPLAPQGWGLPQWEVSGAVGPTASATPYVLARGCKCTGAPRTACSGAPRTACAVGHRRGPPLCKPSAGHVGDPEVHLVTEVT